MSIPHTNSKQDRDFTERLVQEISLDATFVLDWVVENFEPNEVYTNDQLEDWAIDNGWIKNGGE
jgi:hypothetical protein